MDLSDLTPEQAARIGERIVPMLRYLSRLTDRMQQRGWSGNDPLYVRAWEARDALHELRVRLHYHSLGPGTAGNAGQPTPQQPRPWEPGGSGRGGA